MTKAVRRAVAGKEAPAAAYLIQELSGKWVVFHNGTRTSFGTKAAAKRYVDTQSALEKALHG